VSAPDDAARVEGDAAGGSPAGEGAAEPAESMSFLDHLEELRRVLIHSVVAGVAAAILCWFWSGPLLDILVRPVQEHGVFFTRPNEAFVTRLKLAAVCGLFLVLPFVLWKVYGFVLPALYRRERRVVTPLILASTLLFYLGVAFSFLVVCPAVIRFLLTFGTEVMQPLIGIGPYFSFVAQLSLAFGLVFELPVLVFFLSLAGIVDPRRLLSGWRYALLLIVVVAAVLTPPDIFSQLAMAIPVSLLYISSVLVSIAATRRRRREARDETPAPPA
jgi:sec-independent protein translocase protein TatC